MLDEHLDMDGEDEGSSDGEDEGEDVNGNATSKKQPKYTESEMKQIKDEIKEEYDLSGTECRSR